MKTQIKSPAGYVGMGVLGVFSAYDTVYKITCIDSWDSRQWRILRGFRGLA